MAAVADASFREGNLGSVAIRDLKLKIEGTRLQPLVDQLLAELHAAGLRKIRPQFYLSTEWGVPFDSVCIAIPFYLAAPQLTELHAERHGHIEGFSPEDILRYLRHELGHVVGYAYRLYEEKDWVNRFGVITQPYLEEYHPEPFSPRFVRHLPGWYGQKHPDEDWAETFAVWLTPGSSWRGDYADWPDALAKLEYCDRTMKRLADTEPLAVRTELHEDVGDLAVSLDQYYCDLSFENTEFPRGLDGALRAIFEDLGMNARRDVPRRSAAELMKGLERDLMNNVFRWTGHFPERTRLLVRHLARRSKELGHDYPETRESRATVAVTTLVTSLAMNHVLRGSYLP